MYIIGFRLIFQGILRAAYNAKFRRYHTLTLSILKRFGFGNTMIENRIQREVEALIKIFESFNGVEMYPSEEIMHCGMNVIVSIMFGKRLDTLDSKAQGFIHQVKDSFKMFALTARLNFFPWLRYFPRYRKVIADAGSINDGIRCLMEEKIRHCG